MTENLNINYIASCACRRQKLWIHTNMAGPCGAGGSRAGNTMSEVRFNDFDRYFKELRIEEHVLISNWKTPCFSYDVFDLSTKLLAFPREMAFAVLKHLGMVIILCRWLLCLLERTHSGDFSITKTDLKFYKHLLFQIYCFISSPKPKAYR